MRKKIFIHDPFLQPKELNRAVVGISLTMLLLMLSIIAFGQNIGINTTGAAPDPSAMLDISSTTQGLLIPRLTIAQRNAISSPAAGLIIFNTDCIGLEIFNGSNWIPVFNSNTLLPFPGTITGTTTPCVNQTGVAYSAGAVNGATTYTWTVPSDATVASGQGTNSITVNFGSNSGDVCVKAASNCANSISSCSAVTVSASSPASVSISASPSATICACDNITFTATPTNGGGSPSYQWKLNGGNVGTNSSTYTNAALDNADAITCVMTSNLVCATGNPATSNTITMSVNPGNGWKYRKPVALTNSTGTNLTDYEVKLTVSFVASKMNADFSDIRFTDATCSQTLNYYVESYIASTSAVVWVKVPSIPTSGATIYLYYGKASATSASNAPATFVFWDDCSSTAGWTISANTNGSGTFISSGGHFEMTYAGVCCSWGGINVDKNLSSAITGGKYTIQFLNRSDKGNSSICTGLNFQVVGTGNLSVTLNDQNYCDGVNHGEIVFCGNTSGFPGAYYSPAIGSGFATFDVKPFDVDNRSATLLQNGSSVASVSGGATAPNLTTVRMSTSAFSTYTAQMHIDNIIMRKYYTPEPTGSFGAEENACP